jgi:tRNA pseudouridine55 synthase
MLLNKPRGLTPLQAVERLQASDPSLKGRKIGFAGRLDPTAEGLLLLMLDDENQRVRELRSLEKSYHVQVVFGLRTDSFDLLGAVLDPAVSTEQLVDSLTVRTSVRALVGTCMQQFPPYSGVRVDGHPAFYWARRGQSPPSGWPQRERTVFEATVLSSSALSGATLCDRALADISTVQGEFRQGELSARWTALRSTIATQLFAAFDLAIRCSSGTFMRALANELGQTHSCGAVATRICRTSIGPYKLKDAIALNGV